MKKILYIMMFTVISFLSMSWMTPSSSDNSMYGAEKEVKESVAGERLKLDYNYAKDDKNIYYMGKIIEGADVNTFETISYEYAKDSKNVYYDGKIIKEADSKSFLIIPNNVSGFYRSMDYSYVYVKDDYRVYLHGEVLEGADSLSFQKMGGNIARDKFNIYLDNKKLKNIDVETFEYIGEECSIRNRDMRFECSCCSKVSIFKDKNGEYRTDDKDFVEKFVVK